MAGELKHAPADPIVTQLTQDEWESITAHVLADGVAEDLIKWDGTKFVRVPKGANGTFLGYSGGALVSTTPGVGAPTVVDTAIDYTVLVTDDFVFVDTSAGNRIITLPSAALATRPVTIKKITSDANTVTVVRVGADTIDGEASVIYPGYARTSFTYVPKYDALLDDWRLT